MLEQLSKQDKKWRSIALSICKCPTLADDIVQEMYIKLSTVDKQINDFYVISTIKSLFTDHCRQKNRSSVVSIEEVYTEPKQTNTIYELDDNELEVIQSLKWYEVDYIELNQEMSLREMGKELNTPYTYIFNVIKRAKQKGWEIQEKQKRRSQKG